MPERGPRLWKEGPGIPLEETPEGMEDMPPAGTGPGMSAETAEAVRGIVLTGSHCRSRCWPARGSACRCACGGENHGAMGKGGKPPTAPSLRRPVQTLLCLAPEGAGQERETSEFRKSPRPQWLGIPQTREKTGHQKGEQGHET